MNSLQKILKKIYEPSLSESVSRVLFPTSISLKQGLFLQKITEKYKPKKIIEIGFGYGISSIWINSAKHQSLIHYIVDPNRPMPEYNSIFTFLTNFEHILFVQTESQVFLAKAYEKKELFDFIFIDGDERFDGITTDLYFSCKVLRKNGLILVRNIWNPSVRKSLLFYIKNLPLEIEGITKLENFFIKKIPYFDQLILRIRHKKYDFCILKLKAATERKWNHYVPF